MDIQDEDDMAQRIQDNITNEVMTSIRNSIVDEVKKAIQGSKRELTEMTAEACSSSMNELTEKAAKAARLSLSGEWKHEANKKMHRHNEEVLEQVQRADHFLEKGNVELARECLKSGKSFLKKRMKMIRIADLEELGWKVIKHYESDDLCENSDDEKALNRARRTAIANEKKRSLRSRPRKPYTSRRADNNPAPSSTYPRGFRRFCFYCKREGHTKPFCDKLAREGSKNTTRGNEDTRDGR
jgi:soluble cytochrome b562